MQRLPARDERNAGPIFPLTAPDVGAKGVAALRWKSNIKWGKDRGKNAPGSPWGEDRDNDKHLTRAEKRAARGES